MGLTALLLHCPWTGDDGVFARCGSQDGFDVFEVTARGVPRPRMIRSERSEPGGHIDGDERPPALSSGVPRVQQVRAPPVVRGIVAEAGSNRVRVRVCDRVAEVGHVHTRRVAVAPLEHVTLHPVGGLNGPCDRREKWLHEGPEGPNSLYDHEVEVIRHDDECQ